MKCLTYDESEAWFASFGVRITEHRSLSFPPQSARERRILISDIKCDAPRLIFFSDQLVEWLPIGRDRMLWLNNWETYPPSQTIFFEKVRRGCNENRHIIEAPGHLFEQSTHGKADYERRTVHEHEETATMAGLLLLLVCFNWDGYLLGERGEHYIMIRDNGIVICSSRDSKIKEACTLAKKFNQQYREIHT
jgi:hypothetical protein